MDFSKKELIKAQKPQEKKKREMADPSKMSDDSFLAFFNSLKKEE